MSFTANLALPDWEKVYLLELEIARQIDGESWTQDGGNDSWYISHPEGEPSRVVEDGVEYSEQISLNNCNSNSSSWFWDSGNTRLYVHASGSDDPGGASYIILSYFWEYFSNTAPIVYNSNDYLPYIDDSEIPNISISVSGFQDGKLAQSFGSIKLINADGYFDSRFTDYIYEAKTLIWKIGKRGDIYGDFATLWKGWTSTNHMNDLSVEIEVEDFRKYL